MRIFLIDFENVHSEGLAGVDFLTETDEVVIFHSNNADTITFEMMHKLMFSKAKLSYYKVRRGGRNALDFQMSSYLGYLVNASIGSDNVEFYLISKDNGFDFVIDFWESGNINIKPKVKRFYTIKAAFAQTKPARAPKSKLIPETPPIVNDPPVIEAVLPVEEVPVIIEDIPVVIVEVPIAVITDDNSEEVDKLLSESNSAHELYISTVKRFGQKKGVEIYRNIKSRFITKKTG
jgi:hypothetical protein